MTHGNHRVISVLSYGGYKMSRVTNLKNWWEFYTEEGGGTGIKVLSMLKKRNLNHSSVIEALELYFVRGFEDGLQTERLITRIK